MKKLLSFILLAALWATNANAFTLRFDACGISFAWTATDNVGMMTEEGAQMRYGVCSIAEDEHSATLQCPGWALKEDMAYYAYAPYNSQYSVWENRATSLPVDYSLQRQTGNDNTDHLGQHAFYMGSVKAGGAETDATLHMRPMTSVVRLSRRLGRKASITQILLSVDENLFPLLGYMNLKEESFVGTAFSRSLTLLTHDMQVPAGEEAVAFLTLPACNLEGHTIHITFVDANGNRYEDEADGFDIRPGQTYCIGGETDTTEARDITSETQGTADTPLAVAQDMPIAASFLLTGIATTAPQRDTGQAYDLLGRRKAGRRGGVTIVGGKLKVKS